MPWTLTLTVMPGQVVLRGRVEVDATLHVQPRVAEHAAISITAEHAGALHMLVAGVHEQPGVAEHPAESMGPAGHTGGMQLPPVVDAAVVDAEEVEEEADEAVKPPHGIRRNALRNDVAQRGE